MGRTVTPHRGSNSGVPDPIVNPENGLSYNFFLFLLIFDRIRALVYINGSFRLLLIFITLLKVLAILILFT
jgi:hypothetical protein